MIDGGKWQIEQVKRRSEWHGRKEKVMKPRKDFMLVKFLTALSIFALLVLIVLPSLQTIERQVHSIACRSNLQQSMLFYLCRVKTTIIGSSWGCRIQNGDFGARGCSLILLITTLYLSGPWP